MSVTDHAAKRRTLPGSLAMKSAGQDSTLESKTFEVAISADLDKLPYGSFKAFGKSLRRSDTWVTRMRDPFDTTHIRASQVGRACQAVGSVAALNEVLAEVRIAGRRWHVVPMPEVVPARELVVEGVTASARVSSLVAELVGALGDGKIDAGERTGAHSGGSFGSAPCTTEQSPDRRHIALRSQSLSVRGTHSWRLPFQKSDSWNQQFPRLEQLSESAQCASLAGMHQCSFQRSGGRATAGGHVQLPESLHHFVAAHALSYSRFFSIGSSERHPSKTARTIT